MKASPAELSRLLEIAALDAKISAAEHAKKNPPQTEQVRELLARRQELAQDSSTKHGAVDDLRAELARIESDVAVVDARQARDTERLAASSNPKEAQALEHELGSLARRKSELEDGELEVMQQLEDAQKAVSEVDAQIAEINAEGARLSAEAKQVISDAEREITDAQAARAAVVPDVTPALLQRYDRLAERGIGAAPLVRRTCEGCRMVLSGSDLNDIRQAPADDVLSCPECDCILVRTEESGL